MIVDCPQCRRRHVIVDRADGTLAHCDCGAAIRLPLQQLEAGYIRCGNCGGTPKADDRHCPYCDVALTTIRCARCLAHAMQGDQHCRACGHLLAVAVHTLKPGPRGVLHCPRCNVELQARMVGDAVLDECTRCGGLWLEHEVFRDIVAARRDQEALFAALDRLTPSTSPAPTSSPATGEKFYVGCPQCGTTMDRRQFARVSGVIVDICKPHGVWFDHDELSRIVRFVGQGGMETAQEKLHQKRLAELRAAQQRTSSPVSLPTPRDESIPVMVLREILAAIVSALLR